MYSSVAVLRAIDKSNTSLGSVLKHLHGRPVAGERAARQELNNSFGALEALELITIVRDRYGEVVTLKLTDLGRERLAEANEELERERGEIRERRQQSAGR